MNNSSYDARFQSLKNLKNIARAKKEKTFEGFVKRAVGRVILSVCFLQRWFLFNRITARKKKILFRGLTEQITSRRTSVSHARLMRVAWLPFLKCSAYGERWFHAKGSIFQLITG